MEFKRNNLPFIDNVVMSDWGKIAESINITIEGNWPDPSWAYNKIELDNNLVKQELTIYPLGKKQAGIAAQVLKPFVIRTTVDFESQGNWKVIVVGRDKIIENNITIGRT